MAAIRQTTGYSCIPTVIGRSIANRLTWHNRVPHGAFERLERHAGKLARVVLRGLDGSNPARLPGANKSLISFVLEPREDIVPLRLVLPPNLCLLLTEFHRLTLTCRLGLGFL